jgi:hypothetical protein
MMKQGGADAVQLQRVQVVELDEGNPLPCRPEDEVLAGQDSFARLEFDAAVIFAAVHTIPGTKDAGARRPERSFPISLVCGQAIPVPS